MSDRVTVVLYANTGRRYEDQIVFDYSSLATRISFFAKYYSLTLSDVMMVKGTDGLSFEIKLNLGDYNLDGNDHGLQHFDYLRLDNAGTTTKPWDYIDGYLYAYIDRIEYLVDYTNVLHCRVDVIETYASVNMARIFTPACAIEREHKARFTSVGGYIIDKADENIVSPKFNKTRSAIAYNSGVFNLIKGVNLVYMKDEDNKNIIAVPMLVLSTPFPLAGAGSVTLIYESGTPNQIMYWSPNLKSVTPFTSRYITAIDGGDPYKYFSSIVWDEGESAIVVTPKSAFNNNEEYDGGTLGTFYFFKSGFITLEELVTVTTAVSLTTSRPITPTPPATTTTTRSINHETKLLNSQFFDFKLHFGTTTYQLPYERINVTSTVDIEDNMLLNLGNANYARVLTSGTPIEIELSDHDYQATIPYIKNRQVPDITDEYIDMIKDKSVQRAGNMIGSGIAIGGAVIGALFGIATGNVIAVTGSIVALLGAVTNLGRQAVTAGIENQRMRETAQLVVNQMDDAVLDRILNQGLPYVTTAWPSDIWLSLIENIFYTVGYNANGVMEVPNVRSRYHFNFIKANTGPLLLENISPVHYNEIKKRFADGLLIIHGENVTSLISTDATVAYILYIVFGYGNKEVY